MLPVIVMLCVVAFWLRYMLLNADSEMLFAEMPKSPLPRMLCPDIFTSLTAGYVDQFDAELMSADVSKGTEFRSKVAPEFVEVKTADELLSGV
jgi:hypothetical protein